MGKQEQQNWHKTVNANKILSIRAALTLNSEQPPVSHIQNIQICIPSPKKNYVGIIVEIYTATQQNRIHKDGDEWSHIYLFRNGWRNTKK